MPKFSAAIAETDGRQLPDDHRLLFHLVVADNHDPPCTVSLSIVLYLPGAGESAWPGC